MKKGFFIIFLGAIIPWVIYLIINDKIELANFLVTTLAFGAAIYAIYNQHQESKQAEGNFREQFSLQKEVALKAEIIGAWQVLANKASGNSGKKEAIEFLASQVLPLRHIDMSCKTHGGPVYLNYLFDNFKKDREKISLIKADFSGASLMFANFSGAHLEWADFSQVKRFCYEAFIDCYCWGEDFSQVQQFYDIDWHCWNDFLPKPPLGYKFEFENRTDENNQPIYPENNPDYRYIKLIKLK